MIDAAKPQDVITRMVLALLLICRQTKTNSRPRSRPLIKLFFRNIWLLPLILSLQFRFKIGKLNHFFSLFFQRATLAEKEVNALKEQLATSQNKSSTGDQVNNKMADCEQQTLELISRNNIEGELASKDKEVCKTSRDTVRPARSFCRLDNL